MSNGTDHLRKGVDVPPVTLAMAGSISGLVLRTVTAPLDILKIRLQLSPHKVGSIETLVQIYRYEGLFSLWKGNVPLSLMYALYGSSQFASYAIANTLLTKMDQQVLHGAIHPNLHSFIVGSTAGMASTITSYPFDLLRTRLASNTEPEFRKMRAVLAQIYGEDGIKSFYKGLKPSLISVTLQMGTMFETYELCKNLVRHTNNDGSWSSKIIMNFIDPFSGFISGITAKLCTFPLDLIRKRLQVSSTVSVRQITTEILRKQGPRGFFNGLLPALLKSGPTSAVSLWIYEYSISTLDNLGRL